MIEKLPGPLARAVKATLGMVKSAQARGDFQVLAKRNRRALRVHLGADIAAGLDQPQRAVQQALA